MWNTSNIIFNNHNLQSLGDIQIKLRFSFHRLVQENKGPAIKHQDHAMRLLGIGSQMTDSGAKPVPLSKYSKTEIVQVIHEQTVSFKVFQRLVREGRVESFSRKTSSQ